MQARENFAMHRRKRALAILTVCASLILASVAHAQGEEPLEAERLRTEHEPDVYRRSIDTAIVEYGAGHYEEAYALFTKAHKLAPSARTHRGLGTAAFELRNYVESVEQLEAALRSTEKPLDESLREATVALLERAREYVGELVLELDPADARVVIDGVPLPARGSLPIPLRVGRHELEAQAEAYMSGRRTLEITHGAPQVVVWKLAPLSVARDDSLAQGAREEPNQRAWYRRAWVWTAIGVVAAGSATAVVLATRSPRLSDEYNGSSDVRLGGP